MSSILWLLYFAEVATAISKAAFIVAGGLLAVMTVVSAIQAEDQAERRHGAEMFFNLIKKRYPLPLCMILLACFMPSKQLLYIAVGLNVGKEVVETEIGQKSLDALEAWLDKAVADAQQPTHQ